MHPNLAFLETPNPGEDLWQSLGQDQRVAALDVLARLVAQAARTEPTAEDNDDE